MSRNSSYEQLVSSYFDNEMSSQERLDFENQLTYDSALKEEFEFQNDLIDGIKEARKMELKARLDNIQVTTPLYQTVAFKVAAVATLGVGIGVGAFFLLNDESSDKINLVPEHTIVFEDFEAPEIPEIVIPAESEKIEPVELAKENVKRQKNKDTVARILEGTAKKPAEPTVTVIEPTLDVFDDDVSSTQEINVEEKSLKSELLKSPAEEKVEIATVKDKRNKFHYQFFDSKLYLLGNFDEMPYEIIELHSSAGKKYYLYYNNAYYKLNNNQVKPTPLEKIENDSLINELKIIQLNQNH